MTTARGALRRLGFGQTRLLRAEVAALRQLALETRALTAEMHQIVMTLNHEVHHGVPSSFPLFVGVAERLRTDAEAAVGAAETIDRQLRRLEARLDLPSTVSEPDA